jgi:Dullard-like phosphatase family protein
MKQGMIKLFDNPQNLTYIHLTDTRVSQEFFLCLKSFKKEENKYVKDEKNSSIKEEDFKKKDSTDISALGGVFLRAESFSYSEVSSQVEEKKEKNIVDESQKEYVERKLKQMKVYKQNQKKNLQIDYKKIFMQKSKFKYTLCLDLDETLIYSEIKQKHKEYNYIYEGIIEEKYVKLGINFRPGIKDFLSYASANFEVILFTCSNKEYADIIMDLIDPDYNYFDYRLYRDDCIEIRPNVFTKDLRIFTNRNIKDIILIDNSLISMLYQLDNGYLISPFNSNRNDREFYALIDFLSKNYSNLSEALKAKFNFQNKFDSF